MTVVLGCDEDGRDFAVRLEGDLAAKGVPTIRLDSARRSLSRIDSADCIFVPILTPQFVSTPVSFAGLIGTLLQGRNQQGSPVIPLLAQPCEWPWGLGLTVPVDFTRSYASGLSDLHAQFAGIATSRQFPYVRSRPSLEVLDELFGLIQKQQWIFKDATESSIQAFIRRECRSFNLEFLTADRRSGVDLLLLAGRDVGQRAWLLQFKSYAQGFRSAMEVVESLVPVASEFTNVGVSNLALVCRASAVIKSHIDLSQQQPSFDCWRMSDLQTKLVFAWIRNAPGLDEAIVEPVQDLRERYSALVDKKFLASHSADERLEFARLEGLLDDEDRPFYAPLSEGLVSPTTPMDRHADLVDRRFAGTLSAAEHAELQGLEELFDAEEARLYEPVKVMLRATLRRLSR